MGAENAEIIWKIELHGLNIKRIEVNMGKLETFHNGDIIATVCCGDVCVRIPSETGTVNLEEAKNAEYLLIQVQFSGGTGENAWQHAQLYRTNLDQPKTNMYISIELE